MTMIHDVDVEERDQKVEVGGQSLPNLANIVLIHQFSHLGGRQPLRTDCTETFLKVGNQRLRKQHYAFREIPFPCFAAQIGFLEVTVGFVKSAVSDMPIFVFLQKLIANLKVKNVFEERSYQVCPCTFSEEVENVLFKANELIPFRLKINDDVLWI